MGGGGIKEVLRRLELMRKYADGAPEKISAMREEAKAAPLPQLCESHYDVIVVGFGCAGVAAALTAADEGKRVLVVDRFEAGGSCRRSGGVYYGSHNFIV